MSELQRLINELCPNGVEYVSFGNVCKIVKGVQFNKADMNDEGSYPVINGGINPSGYIEQYNQEGNTITISQGGASAGYVNWLDIKFWLGAHCYAIKPNADLLNRYAYHFIKSQEYKLQECQYGAGIPALAKSTIESLSIPLPPLEVQREIVRILDKYSESVEELKKALEKELSLRKKQYEYYRDKLLDFKSVPPPWTDDVRWRTLGEVATSIYRGSGITRDQITKTGIPCVRYGEIYTKYNTWFDNCLSHTNETAIKNPKYFEYGDILFAITGESVDEIAKSVAYLGHDKCLAGGDIVVLKHNQNPRYLAHVLSTYDARKQKSKGKIKSKVVHSSVPSIENIRIPVPSIDIQTKIADVLDNFEKICSDLNIGLPTEINARQKQYEYYRDKLLQFRIKNA